jgi:hypothetical protein
MYGHRPPGVFQQLDELGTDLIISIILRHALPTYTSRTVPLIEDWSISSEERGGVFKCIAIAQLRSLMPEDSLIRGAHLDPLHQLS